jgi:hypothetical protein
VIVEGAITQETPRAVDATTLGEALRRTAAAHPDLVAVRSSTMRFR